MPEPVIATVIIGNSAPVQPDKVNEAESLDVELTDLDIDYAETTFGVVEGSLSSAVTTVTRTFESYHSREGAQWVESDHKSLEAILADHWDCPTGRPEDWPQPEQAQPQETSEPEDEEDVDESK